MNHSPLNTSNNANQVTQTLTKKPKQVSITKKASNFFISRVITNIATRTATLAARSKMSPPLLLRHRGTYGEFVNNVAEILCQ